MITKVKVEYFKKFANQAFDLGNDIVLVGPNNSGKTTLLQAVATWNLALQRWVAEHAESSKAKQRTGMPISRNDFTTIPLREMNLLWLDRDTGYSDKERAGYKAGQPKLIQITLYGKGKEDQEWNLGITFRYANKEQIYLKLADELGKAVAVVPTEAKELKIVHVPLRDPVLFAQADVEYGAVGWPGEVDLAPDAMYDEIKKHGRWVPE
jgi:ABC-type cobalamin/Fe3+-siderophores transport system ATPase subunit